jgi:hypothetical protein
VRPLWSAAPWLCLAAVSLPVCAGDTERPLEGSYAFRGRTAVDPPPAEAQDTHLSITLTGQSARDLYQKMRTRPKRDECLDDGSLTKTIGQMQCSELVGPKRYTCTFAIDVARQRIDAGSAC